MANISGRMDIDIDTTAYISLEQWDSFVDGFFRVTNKFEADIRALCRRNGMEPFHLWGSLDYLEITDNEVWDEKR